MSLDRIKLTGELHQQRLVAVVRSKSADEALALARAATDGGVKFIEITFSVPGALDVIKELARRNDLHVGAGTVLAPQQAERAIGAGAEFVVSPSLELNLIAICHMANIACFPGAATPTEIIAAQRAHADLIKIFPADLAGGPYFIRQMQGPFPKLASWSRAASISRTWRRTSTLASPVFAWAAPIWGLCWRRARSRSSGKCSNSSNSSAERARRNYQRRRINHDTTTSHPRMRRL